GHSRSTQCLVADHEEDAVGSAVARRAVWPRQTVEADARLAGVLVAEAGVYRELTGVAQVDHADPVVAVAAERAGDEVVGDREPVHMLGLAVDVAVAVEDVHRAPVRAARGDIADRQDPGHVWTIGLVAALLGLIQA